MTAQAAGPPDPTMAVGLRQDDLEWREIGGEIIALDVRTALYLAVGGSGTLLWRLLAQLTTRGDLVSTLVTTYRIDPSVAAADVEEFLAALDQCELLAP